jgi:hypothetical protein
MPTWARQSSQTFPQGCIQAFAQGRIELLASWRHAEQVLCLLKRSPGERARDLHHPFLFRPFDDRRDAQLWPDF